MLDQLMKRASKLEPMGVAAKSLGVFSLVLGLAELVAPKKLGRKLGLENRRNLIRGYGAREFANGVALMAARNPVPWLWTRVAGDGLDLATLGWKLRHSRLHRRNIGLAIAAVGAIALIDMIAAGYATKSRMDQKKNRPDYTNRSGFPRNSAFLRDTVANANHGGTLTRKVLKG